MKKLYTAIAILLIFSLASTAVILVLAPDIIPAHYNAAGEIDRCGSKYEQLIFPGFSLVFAAGMLGLLRFEKRRGMPEEEQRVLLYVTAFGLALFGGLGLFFGIAAIRHGEVEAALEAEAIVKLLGICTGLMLVVLGNLMPKARRNSWFGLRTKWSMASDRAWQKSQRFGGITGVLCGTVMILLTAVLPGSWSIWVLTGLLLIWAAVCIGMSYRYDRQG